MVTRILFDPRRDLPTGATQSNPVTIEATPTGIREDGQVVVYPTTITFTITTGADILQLPPNTASNGWRLTARDKVTSTILQTRVVRVPDQASIAYQTLPDIDPSSFEVTPGTARQWDATFWALVQAGAGGGLTDSGIAALIGVPTSAVAVALAATSATLWKASTAYAAGQAVINPSGQLTQVTTAHTSTSTYDAMKFTITGGGSGGGVTATDTGYDVYLLAGQSNMSGRGGGYSATNYDPPSTRIQQYAAAGALANDVAQANEPLGFPDVVTLGPIGMGPGLVFGRWVQDATPTNRRILLVPVAYGGSGFSTGAPLNWDPAQSGNLYTQAIAQANAAMAAAGPRARFMGILWVQGEYDVGMSQAAYAAKLDTMLAGFRAGITGASATTPFVIGRMAPGFVTATSGAPNIEAAHIDTPTRNAYTAVAAGPSGFDDNLHYTAPGQRILGRNIFEAFLVAKAATTTQANTAPAAVTGLTATPTTTTVALTWTPQGRTASYKIERSADGGSTWTTLAATSYLSTYTDTGRATATAYVYRVSGTNSVGAGATATVSTTTLSAPTVTNTAVPTITGTATQGQVLTTSNGSWSATPDSYTYQWKRAGTAISGATASTYTLAAGDVGSTITVTVTAVKAGYVSGTATSAATGTVGATGPTTYAADSFTRTNSTTTMGTTPTGAKAWTALSGTWGIISNQAYDAVAAAGTNHVAVVDTVQADGTVSATVGALGSDNTSGGLIFRASDDSNYWMVTSGGTVYKKVSGGFNSMGGSGAAGAGQAISVVLLGASITVKVGTSTIYSATDAFNQTATKHGLRAYGQSDFRYSAFSHTSATS